MVDRGGTNVPPVLQSNAGPQRATQHTSGSRSGSGSGSSTFSNTRRSRSSASTEPPSEPKPPPRKKQNKRERGASTSQLADDDPKRQIALERNRVAASKCRKKKKEWVSELQETKAGLENHHQQLQREYNGLLDEVSLMKNELISHAHCNDPNIDLWLDNEAKRFVQRATERYGHTHPGAAGLSGFADMRAPSVASTRHSFDATMMSPSSVAASQAGSIGSTGGMNFDHMPDSVFDHNTGNCDGV
ncbi:hypothetical protein ACRALDRAFT_1073718 [Sodiomyces alcalophilus JCM 7366]|uniref:uncharacterized protein n=1 Tax=Sodiomyces alcalophilus JCM 7366 TaxID=591952 RepID=UPI0039B5D92E